MDFATGKELLHCCEETGKPISRIMIEREIMLFGESQEKVMGRMAHSYDIMKEAVKAALDKPLKSMGGLIGGEGIKLTQRAKSGKPVCGALMSRAVAYAMGVLEVNASMGLIVAAPTAGASGVIPGAFLAVQEEFGFSDEQMTEALFHAAAIGYLIMRHGSISGAEAACQAEVGSASAMAAAAVTELNGGTPAQCMDAASTALSNLMGLICDPIAGLVEAPCQKRNSIGVSNALVSAEIALSGIGSLVPLDEMIEAMYQVGLSMPRELKETAQGGIAVTPAACAICSSFSSCS